MAEAKKYPYVVYYNDGSFQTLKITKADYKSIEECMIASGTCVATSIGVLRVSEIRSLLELIMPETQQEVDPAEEYPAMSMEEHAYLYFEKQRIEAEQRKQAVEVEY